MMGDMNIKFDKTLWFETNHCSGKHYFLGNPHTFIGRMMAWCPTKQVSFFVSKKDISECSNESSYWINEFLFGTEPESPLDEYGDVDFESPDYKKWKEEIKLFHETGYWNEMERKCEKCNEILLRSEDTTMFRKCT